MKRFSQGINVDEGVPLIEQSEIELLYVDCYPAQSQQLIDWINNEDEQAPLVLAGQIGSGKSTLLNNAVNVALIKPDCWINLDEDADVSLGGFIALTLASLVTTLLENKVPFITNKTLVSELMPDVAANLTADVSISHWQALCERLNPQQKNLTAFQTKKDTQAIIDNHTEYFLAVIGQLIGDFKTSTHKRPLIIAAGIDKFPATSVAYYALVKVLDQLKAAKTLFEVNAIHLFDPQCHHEFSQMEHTILLARVDTDQIEKMLSKRLGIYAATHENNLRILAEFSGGNARQAVRLLMHYWQQKKDRSSTDEGAIAHAVKRTVSDYFAYSVRPEKPLIQTVMKDQFLLAATLSRIGDTDTGLRAIYGNWVLLGNAITADKWAAMVNPIVAGLFLSNETPVEYMLGTFERYAKNVGMSPMGLSFNHRDDHSRHDSYHALFAEVDQFIDANLAETLAQIAAALLNSQRPDRTFIVYKDAEMISAARSYLLAKSNTYEQQTFKHFLIPYAPDDHATAVIDKLLIEVAESAINILSLEFADNWPIEQLAQLESKRDCFVNQQVLWWIRDDKLTKLLAKIPQLRQLFDVFALEDVLETSLSITEIEDDIAYLTAMNEAEDHPPLVELKKVASYLHTLKVVQDES